MPTITPTLISKKRSESSTVKPTFEQRVANNRKRSSKISNNARKAKKLHTVVQSYLVANVDKLDQEQLLPYFTGLRRNLEQCCSHSLYRVHQSNGATEYIASQMCKHKLCPNCNAERSKALRKKYRAFFDKNEFIDKHTGQVITSNDFNFMHLTLTVPHNEAHGWRNKRFYAKELMQEFNYMRKKDFWKQQVWGGEFGVEVTKNPGKGLHIHLHSLLIVYKNPHYETRNNLLLDITENWNMQTADKYSTRTEFDAKQIKAIKKMATMPNPDYCVMNSNPAITPKRVSAVSNEYIARLNPQGSTMISLENLYTWEAKGDTMVKKYVTDVTSNHFMAGIMECIKYHFKPLCMDDSGVYDFDLLCELLPNIHRQPMYRKFGNLHGVKELNIVQLKDNGISPEAMAEAINDYGTDVVNPLTGAPSTEYTYVVTNARNVFHNWKGALEMNIMNKNHSTNLYANDIYGALLSMLSMSMQHTVAVLKEDEHGKQQQAVLDWEHGKFKRIAS